MAAAPSAAELAAAAAAEAVAKERLFSAWLVEATAGDAILGEAADARADQSNLLNKHGNTALLVDGDEPVVVHWVGGRVTSAMSGRRVRLDRLNRLVYSVPVNVPKKPYRGCEMLHPNCGVRMVKRRSDAQDVFRPTLPAGMLRLRRIHRRLLDGDRCCPVGTCHVCSKATMDKDSCVACALCGLFWHTACSAALFEWAVGSKVLRREPFASHSWSTSKYPTRLQVKLGDHCELLCELCHGSVAT